MASTTTATFCTCVGILLLAAVTSAVPTLQNCLRACPMTFDPVCDNQGTTHPNSCTMHVVACRRRVTLQVEYKGICQRTPPEPKPSSPAATPAPRRNLLGRIISLISGRPSESEKRCLFICPLNYRPVCASDRRTYPNECTMRSQACRRRATLTVKHRGPCHFWDR